MTHPVTLRPCAGIEEVPTLLEVWKSSSEGRRDLVSAADIDWMAQVLEAVYTGRVRIVVAEEAGNIAGFMVLDSERMHLLWVHHDWRQHGVGRGLLAEAQRQAPGLLVEANEQNLAGLAFYRSCGFEPLPVGDVPHRLPPGRIWLRHSGTEDSHGRMGP